MPECMECGSWLLDGSLIQGYLIVYPDEVKVVCPTCFERHRDVYGEMNHSFYDLEDLPLNINRFAEEVNNHLRTWHIRFIKALQGDREHGKLER